jgi:SAM-dependent methyltransferase
MPAGLTALQYNGNMEKGPSWFGVSMQSATVGPVRFDGIGPVERGRYETLKSLLGSYRWVLEGKQVLDFGAGYGLSMGVLLELGAASVIGVEPDRRRVEKGVEVFRELGLADRLHLLYVADTRSLPFHDSAFDLVLANAVLEHIPQPRTSHIRELWRLVKVGGYLLVNETPNKYLPVDVHTTKLALVPWLPSTLAHRYAVWRGRFDRNRGDWASSGWRGMGFWEFTGALTRDFDLIPERGRFRHRLLWRLGLPTSLLDPYPTYLVLKLPQFQDRSSG